MPNPDKNSTKKKKGIRLEKQLEAYELEKKKKTVCQWHNSNSETPRESMIKLTQWNIHKLARYKINMQNSIASVNTNSNLELTAIWFQWKLTHTMVTWYLKKVHRYFNGERCFLHYIMLEQGTIYVREKKMNFNPYLISYSKTNSEWIVDLNIRTKTIKF